ncbi:MAG: shikimate dehydrogenase [Rubrivivax sp.]
MDKYCVLGNPVEHSRSPWIHARFAELTGQRLEYGKRLVPIDGFTAGIDALRAEGGKGCNITVPFKFRAAALATTLTPRAQLAQACNTVRFDGADAVFADNTDGIGLVSDIQSNAGIHLAGRELLLVGAGGAAAGVLGPLIEAGPRRVVVCNRSADKAEALVARHLALAREHGVLLQCGPLDAPGEAFDVVVNATASSLAGGGVPVPDRVIRPGALAVDMMYGPSAHGFMDWARRHGAVPRDGLGMLVEQAAEAFLVFRGVRPPSARVLAELRALLD